MVTKIIGKENEDFPKVWNRLVIKTMTDHHNLYLKCDVLLLANVFEKCRNSSLKNCELWLSHYLSAPALIWDTMLSVTKVELNLFHTGNCIYSLRKV